MQITEIYRSIQGESTYAGVACVFVRLTACNLRCSWCDTEYSFYGGRKMSPDEVFDDIVRVSPTGGLVEITGGEPLLQERELVPLLGRLIGRGYRVLLETSGERPLQNVPPEVVKIVDIKCPGSGEGGTFSMANLDALGADDEVKFVLSDRRDYEFARHFVREHDLSRRVHAVIFSPAFRKDALIRGDASNCLLDPAELARWMLADRVPARLGLQMHKFIWDPALKGV